jgi:hypothetical protein
MPSGVLEPLEPSALRVIARHGGWKIGNGVFANYCELVREYGLPDSQESLIEYFNQGAIRKIQMVGDWTEITKYIDTEGRVKIWPSRRNRKYQLEVLKYLASKGEPNISYTEKEVTKLIDENHTFGDPAMLRREMFEAKLLDRRIDGSVYWRVS